MNALLRSYILPTTLAIGILIVAGWVHGDWTNRWGDAPELQYSVEYLPRLPKTLGPWVGEDLPETPEQKVQHRAAELRAAVTREYVLRDRGERITVMVVSGTPGPIGTHTPEACYNGAGYLMALPPSTLSFPATNSEDRDNIFWVDDFRSDNPALRTGLKLYWSYRPCDPTVPWSASTKPRADFAPYRALYKMYVIRQMEMPGPSPVTDELTPEFIKLLLPALESVVFQPMRTQTQQASAR
jgi:hypothetical protein